jgi:hypothetical protein
MFGRNSGDPNGTPKRTGNICASKGILVYGKSIFKTPDRYII